MHSFISVYDGFHAAMAELRNCSRDFIAGDENQITRSGEIVARMLHEMPLLDLDLAYKYVSVPARNQTGYYQLKLVSSWE